MFCILVYREGMQNAPKYTGAQGQILEAHLRILSEAVKDVERYEVGSGVVYEALEWIENAHPQTRWPCCQFRNALEVWSPQFLQSAWYALQKSLNTPTNDL